MRDRNLSPTAKRRREIVADVECGIAYAAGALTMVVAWAFLRALGVL